MKRLATDCKVLESHNNREESRKLGLLRQEETQREHVVEAIHEVDMAGLPRYLPKEIEDLCAAQDVDVPQKSTSDIIIDEILQATRKSADRGSQSCPEWTDSCCYGDDISSRKLRGTPIAALDEKHSRSGRPRADEELRPLRWIAVY
jgi:hypothetical protein